MNDTDSRHLVNAIEALPEALKDMGIMVQDEQVESIMAELARIITVTAMALWGNPNRPLTAQAKAEMVKMSGLEHPNS